VAGWLRGISCSWRLDPSAVDLRHHFADPPFCVGPARGLNDLH
jgi:hypothetical protein